MASGSEPDHGSAPVTAATAFATDPRTAVAATVTRDGCFGVRC